MTLCRSCRESLRKRYVQRTHAIDNLPPGYGVKRNAVALEPCAGPALDVAGQQDFFARDCWRRGFDPRREATDLCPECFRAAERFSIEDERQHVVDEASRGCILRMGRLSA